MSRPQRPRREPTDVDANLLTFRQAATKICRLPDSRYSARKLERRIVAKEKKLRREFVIRLPGAERENRRILESTLRTWFPELMPTRSNLEQLRGEMGDYMRRLDDRVTEASARFVSRYVEPQMTELWKRDEELAEKVNILHRRVARFEDPPKPVEDQRQGPRVKAG